jgi:hypothetical protein
VWYLAAAAAAVLARGRRARALTLFFVLAVVNNKQVAKVTNLQQSESE